MSQKYKKIGVTTGGYRGERAVLDERVIEGFSVSEFSSGILKLNADSEQTQYLTPAYVQNGYIIVLPEATTLWNNWRTTIINNSNFTIPVYYYTNDPSLASNLVLLKEITAGNMSTFILLDNTSEQGTWTTFRTAETVSAETTEKYTSDVYEKFDISFGQLQGGAIYNAFISPSSDAMYTLDNPVKLSSEWYNNNLQLLNPQPTFTVGSTNWVLQNITNVSCTQSQSVYTGSNGAYLVTNDVPSFSSADSWEIKVKYTYQGGGTYPVVFGSYDQNLFFTAPYMVVEGGVMYVYLTSSNLVTADIANRVPIGLNPAVGTTYYITLSFDNTRTNTYQASYSTVGFDDPSAIVTNISQSTNTVYNGNVPLMFLNSLRNPGAYYSLGSVDLNETSITIDGTETKFGYYPEQSVTVTTIVEGEEVDIVYTKDASQNIVPSLPDNIINISRILAQTPLKSIYFKPTQQFTSTEGSPTLTVSIGTQTEPTKFFNKVNILGAVSDSNFNKDLYEEILSNSSDVQLIATFEGSNLNALTAGNLEVIVEKAKLIDPSILRNAIVSTQVPVGSIFNYAFDDTPVGYIRLNGVIVDNAINTIPNFVEYLNKVNNRLVEEKLIIPQEQWEQIYNTYGSCGKFAWYGTGLRFPAVNCFIKGLSSVTNLSKLTPAGLPNITGSFCGETSYATGAFYNTGTLYGGRYKDNNKDRIIGFDASRSNSIYGNSNTVTPTNIQYPYIMSVFNKVQWTSQADYDALIAASFNKANIDLNNVTDLSSNFIPQVRRIIAPDYANAQGRATDTLYTATEYGYVHINMEQRTTRESDFYINSKLMGRYRTWEDKYGVSSSDDAMYFVSPGDTYQLNVASGLWYLLYEFIPCKE